MKCGGANEFRVSGSTSSRRSGDISEVGSERAVNLFSDSDALTFLSESLDCCYQSAERVGGGGRQSPLPWAEFRVVGWGSSHVRLHGWIYDVLLRNLHTLCWAFIFSQVRFLSLCLSPDSFGGKINPPIVTEFSSVRNRKSLPDAVGCGSLCFQFETISKGWFSIGLSFL